MLLKNQLGIWKIEDGAFFRQGGQILLLLLRLWSVCGVLIFININKSKQKAAGDHNPGAFSI